MSHKINLELTDDEKSVAEGVAEAKRDLKAAELVYSETLKKACEQVHYRKIAHYTRQSDGAIRMQLRRISNGLTGRPR